MRSTVKALDYIESAVFEQLCGQALRRMIPELANLIPSGVNADGRTIKSLSDGFCFIEHNHYASVHITTNRSNLKKKWLYNGTAKTTPKGDLIKGIQQAIEMYATNDKYRFTIYLVSNRPVSEDLHIKVNQHAVDAFITVKIIEQRDLISFLDYDPEGQYVRMKILGIDAEHLSASLLKDITKNNLIRYGQEIYLDEGRLTKVTGQTVVHDQLSASSTVINLLTGDSGFGKSTMCFAMIRNMLEEGGIAIRVSPPAIHKASSLQDAILQQLITEYPTLFVAGTDIENFFQNGLVVIDDINKSDNAPAILDKIISWNQPKQNGNISVLCPVWPQNLAALDNKAKKVLKFSIIPVGRFSFNDCKAIIKQTINDSIPLLTEQQIHSLIIDTGFDPLLLEFSLQRLYQTKHYTATIAGEAINSYVADKTQQVCNQHQVPVYLIKQTLILLAREMLKSHKLDPHLKDLRNWLGVESEEYRIIKMIASQRQLISFDDEGSCYFRHDRVREYLLISAAVGFFDDFITHQDVLADPFYAEITGAALAKFEIQKQTLEALIEANPLAVYCSLKYLQEHSSGSKLIKVTDVIRQWVASFPNKRIPRGITTSISYTLIGFDVKQIEIITQNFPNSAELHLARFRNGNWLAGVHFFSCMEYFYPEAPTYWWISILSHVKAKYLAQTIQGLYSYLPESFTADGINHAYTLVGYLEDPKLLPALEISWKKYANPKNYVSYLWAILKSSSKGDGQIVKDALSYWSTIPNESKKMTSNKRFSTRSIDEQLRLLHWKFSDEQQALLIELSTDTELQEILSFLFAKMDHPVALEIVLNQEMQRTKTKHWHNQGDSRWNRSNTRDRLSEQSLQYLLQEFTNQEANPVRRYLAWCYWTGNVDSEIALRKLQDIASEEDFLYEKSIFWRIRHHDHEAFRAIKPWIAMRPWLIRFLDDIWNEETYVFVDDWFRQEAGTRKNENLSFGLELLAMLDNEDACRLLVNHWEKLKSNSRAIETALFLSTPITKMLADKEIKRLGFDPDQPLNTYYYRNLNSNYFSEGDKLTGETKADLRLLAEQFKYLHLHYGAKYEGKPERLNREKLESLLPYLRLLDSYSIYQFARDSLRIGAADLCYDKFFPLLDKYLRKKIRATTDDVKQDIIRKFLELEREKAVDINQWIEGAEKRGITNEILTEAIESFSNEHHNENALFIIYLILKALGTRRNIAIFDRFNLEQKEQSERAAYWKANAAFLIRRRGIN